MRKKRIPLWLKLTLAGLIVLILGGTAVSSVVFAYLIQGLPAPEQLTQRKIVQSTKIFDRTGGILLYEIHGEEKRTIVPFEEIPEYLKQAAIAIEDKNFYTHPAFDWRGLVRAFIKNLLTGEVQGGSTITQQLAKNVFLSREKTIWRKIREIVISIQIEKRFTKDEILGMYLNQIPYGSNSYGVEAASQTYFLKPVSEITLAEAALLASLPQAPSYYSPWGKHADELEKRRRYVLDRMFELDFIDAEETERAKSAEIAVAPQSTGAIKAPHFTLMVKDYLIEKYGEEMVSNGGLKVLTTLDYTLEEIAEKVVREGAERNEELYGGKNSALVAEDASTGQILALVGSRDWFDVENEGNFNVAAQGLRQPGSAIKPFVYYTAFKKGFTPDTIVFDAPTDFNATGNPSKSYEPKNFSKDFKGPITLKEALAQSINIPSVKVLYLAGIADTLDNAAKFGITTLNDRRRYGLSLVLGGGEVKLIDIVHAYSVFAEEGIRHPQSIVLKVEDAEGRILEEYSDRPERVAEKEYTNIVNQILSDKELRRPLFSASLNLTVFDNREVALKTGTTNEYVDAWTIGYTPSLVVGVWAGNNDNTPMKPQASSILAAVPIWHNFMKEILPYYPEETFNRPAPLTYPSNKPILLGQLPASLHDILYYIDKNNPWGANPANPSDDPQFENWEKGVSAWLLSPQNRNRLAYSAGSKPEIANLNLQNGMFLKTPFNVDAEIRSASALKEINLYLNNLLINQESNPNLNPELNIYKYVYTVNAGLSLQNNLKIQAIDVTGNIAEKEIIIFK